MALGLVAATFIAYQPVWHAGFIWDDDDYVTNNTTLRTLDGSRRIWFELGATSQYYPLTHTSFWVEYHLWRLNPLGYHVVNVTLHALNAILIGLVLRKLRVNGAWLAATIFALHPVHVESVAWVTAASAVLLVFSTSTWHRARVFQSNQELWEDTLRKNPGAFIAHNNLGTILREKGQYAEAIAHWREASRIDPNAWEPHMNPGKLFLDTGKYQEAVAEFREALRLAPKSVEPRYGLGMTYAKLGQYKDAQAEFEETLRARPEDGKAHYWLGAVEDHQGHVDAAIQHYLLAIHYEPALADAYIDLGLLRQKRGELDRAIKCFQTATRLRPDDNRARAALTAVERLREQTRH